MPDINDTSQQTESSYPTLEDYGLTSPFQKIDPEELHQMYRLEQPFSALRRKRDEWGSSYLTDEENMALLSGSGNVVGPLEQHLNQLGDRLYNLCRSVNICSEFRQSDWGVCPQCMEETAGEWIEDELDYDAPAMMEYDSDEDALECESCGLKIPRDVWEEFFLTGGTDMGGHHIGNFMSTWLAAKKKRGPDSIPDKIMAIHYMINAIHGSGDMAPMFFSGKTGDIRKKLTELSSSSIRMMTKTASEFDADGYPELADSMDRYAARSYIRIPELPNIQTHPYEQALKELLTGKRWNLTPFKIKDDYHFGDDHWYHVKYGPHPRPDMNTIEPDEASDTAYHYLRDLATHEAIPYSSNHKMLRHQFSLKPESNLLPRLDVGPEEGSIFRGLSDDEIKYILETGDIRSNDTYNFEGQAGNTCFTCDPEQALSYANSFAPYHMKPNFNHPGYIVKIKRPSDDKIIKINDPEVEVRSPIPAEMIQDIIRIQPYATKEGFTELMPPRASYSPYYQTGSGGHPINYVGFEHLGPLSDFPKKMAQYSPEMTRIASKLDTSGNHDLADRIDKIIGDCSHG